MKEVITKEVLVNNSNQLQQQMTELLTELVEHHVENKIELNKLPDENLDLEQYEGTPVEDLVQGSYLSGKLDMIEEIREYIMENRIKIK